MKFHVWRTACLQEDEGQDHYRGVVEAADEQSALGIAAAQWGENGYFSKSNFRARPIQSEAILLDVEYDGIELRIELQSADGMLTSAISDSLPRFTDAPVVVQRLRDFAERIEKAYM